MLEANWEDISVPVKMPHCRKECFYKAVDHARIYNQSRPHAVIQADETEQAFLWCDFLKFWLYGRGG